MNNLEALIIVRNCALSSQQLRTKQGQAALKVVDRKIQSLLRKKAWREGTATPIHMEAGPGFQYPVPASPLTAAVEKLRLALESAETGATGARLADYAAEIRALLPDEPLRAEQPVRS